MKQILLMIALVAMVGCGKKPAEESVFDQGRPDVTKPSKPPAKTEAQIEAENKAFAVTKAKAEAGDVDAQFYLGVMYGFGNGVGQNFVTAYACATIAAANGHNIAPRFKSQFLEPKKTPAQIAKAGELFKEMVKKNPKLMK